MGALSKQPEREKLQPLRDRGRTHMNGHTRSRKRDVRIADVPERLAHF